MKSYNVALINFDWRDVFTTSFDELEEKLERDRLMPKVNNFFMFSWSTRSYEGKKGNIQSVHKKTSFRFFRPFLDLMSAVVVPLTLKRKGFKPDAVIVYDFGLLPTCYICKLMFGSKVILVINNMPVLYSKTRKWGGIKQVYSYVIERLFKGLADKVFTINEAMKTYLLGVGFKETDIAMFAMNTILRDKEFIEKSRNGYIREKYKIPAETMIIVTVARLEAEKDYPRHLETIAALGEGYISVILGAGSKLESLKEQAKKLGIENRVFFEGFVRRDMIWNYYKDADLFMLLSKAEALGVVVWEAMYMNVPVIGSDAEGIIESTGPNGERGFIYRIGEPLESLKKKVSFCITPSPERDAMLKRAKEYVDKQIENKITLNDIIA